MHLAMLLPFLRNSACDFLVHVHADMFLSTCHKGVLFIRFIFGPASSTIDASKSQQSRDIAQFPGLTTERVLINMDTEMNSNLINARFAYVSISRASHDLATSREPTLDRIDATNPVRISASR